MSASMTRREAILADLQAGVGRDVEIACRHGVTPGRISQIRRAARLPKQSMGRASREGASVFWTDDDFTYLIEHADEPVRVLAPALGRSIRAVYEMRRRLIEEGRIPRRRVPMKDAELALLADPSLTHAAVAARTGRSAQVIADARRRRGIRIARH
jgi:hypothetical protein